VCLVSGMRREAIKALFVNGFVLIPDFNLTISRRECHYPPIFNYPPDHPPMCFPLRLQFRKETLRK